MSNPTTFLELVQKVHQESGLSSGSRPSTVVSQTGYAKKIVDWTNDAWFELQGMFETWRFMRVSTSAILTVGYPNYTIASAPFAITDFARWDLESFTVNTVGELDKSRVTWKTYDEFKQLYELATTNSGRPTIWTAESASTIRFNALPDVGYEWNGRYWRAPSNMAVDADVPTNLPKRFYMLIVWGAVRSIALDRGTNEVLARATIQEAKLLSQMMSSELEVPTETKVCPIC